MKFRFDTLDMKQAIGGFLASPVLFGFAVALGIPTLTRDWALALPAASFLALVVMPNASSLLGAFSFYGAAGLLYVVLRITGSDDPRGLTLALLVLVYMGASAGAFLNAFVRLLWRWWRGAQQRAAGDVRNARA